MRGSQNLKGGASPLFCALTIAKAHLITAGRYGGAVSLVDRAQLSNQARDEKTGYKNKGENVGM